MSTAALPVLLPYPGWFSSGGSPMPMCLRKIRYISSITGMPAVAVQSNINLVS